MANKKKKDHGRGGYDCKHYCFENGFLTCIQVICVGFWLSELWCVEIHLNWRNIFVLTKGLNWLLSLILKVNIIVDHDQNPNPTMQDKYYWCFS